VGQVQQRRSGESITFTRATATHDLKKLQTCIAPDYVIVPKHFQSELAAALEEVYVQHRDLGTHEN
jgi:acyl-CoA reductase-like NAD-dependent aldehyde dehydrogenase